TIDNSVRLYRVQLPDSLDIEANKRYTLKVSRIGQKALAFRLEVSDWGDGAEVTATPPSGAFEYSGFELNDIPLADDRIDLSDNTGANTLKFFTLSENKETGELKASLVLDLGAGYAEEYVLENDVTPVAEGAPVVTYAGGKIKKTYSITLAKTIYPIGGKLTIEDEKTGLDTTFQIMSVLLYDNTEYRPVLVGGYYWAPVNVGATSAVYSETVESCGYIFQWGRSYTEFPYNSVGATYSGSLSAADAYTNRDKFILSGTDWLNPSNDALWSGADAQGPCPDGWKVPTADEWRALQNKCTGAIFDNHCLVISSDAVPSNASLYLPAAGRRSGSNGTFSGQGGAGFYWSSTSFVSSTNAYHFTFSASVDAPVNVNVFGEARSRGFSVRCIQK
ncbi:MAG: fibrobacter succinogenes major paralogous domain-containing protein, partial [Prevotella sp.]|nr:fibrobacter succinogenes major paralogous domain-containing protein [Prevotella sp.]